MPRRSAVKLTRRTVEALRAGDREYLVWDRDLPGFGIRVHATGRKTYVVQSRGPGGLRRASIARHGDVSAQNARKKAARMIDRIKQGKDPVEKPAEPEPTVANCRAVWSPCGLTATQNRGAYGADRQPHPAGPGSDADRRGEAPGRVGPEPPPPRHPLHGQQRHAGAVEDVPAGRALGADAGGEQPVPLHPPVPGARPGTLPDASGVRPGGGSASGGRDGRVGLGERHRRAAAADAHRVPPRRDSHAALGGRGPHGGGASASQDQDRAEDGADHPGRGARAGGRFTIRGQSLGHRRAPAPNAAHAPSLLLGKGARAGRTR